MKKLPALVLILCWPAFANTQPKLQKQAIILKRVIEKNHYAPKPVDDGFSVNVFNAIIDELDSRKLYFTADDIAILQPFNTKIDDELNGKSWGFTTQLINVYRTSLIRADSMYKTVLQKPLDLTTSEYFQCPDKRVRPKNIAEYQLFWKQYMKWLLLNEIKEEADEEGVKMDKAFVAKNEQEAQEKILGKAAKRYNKILGKPGEVEATVGELYLNKIASVFDPHTEYFSPDEKNSFEEELSTQAYDYGFTLSKNEKGEYNIAGIVPGSAAWKSGAIHKNDILVQIQNGTGKPLVLKDTSEDAVEEMLSSTAIKRITATVRSADGSEKVITLEKQLQQNDDNTVTGFILTNTKKIGYLSLPSFYTQWGDNGGTGCANDVAKEIVKLKNENIDGLILDLRYNGGGSVNEAIELAGIFIDAGPLAMLKTREPKPTTLKDPARGTIYDGPMAVMINGQSASASELLAGTLQDYHRAVICGSNSFGKATMQQILPLDTMFNIKTAQNESALAKEYGYVKTTLGKIYRVTGNTAQLTGVVPDVILPDAFELADYTERSQPFALASDTITKNQYYTPLPDLPVGKIKAASAARISSSVYFNDLNKNMADIRQIKEDCKTPVQWEAFVKWYDEKNQLYKPDTSEIASKSFTVQNSAFTSNIINLDSYQKELNTNTKKDVQDDPYIEEAFLILLDMLLIKN